MSHVGSTLLASRDSLVLGLALHFRPLFATFVWPYTPLRRRLRLRLSSSNSFDAIPESIRRPGCMQAFISHGMNQGYWGVTAIDTPTEGNDACGLWGFGLTYDRSDSIIDVAWYEGYEDLL